MKKTVTLIVLATVLIWADFAWPLIRGTEIVVPAAARTGGWVTDLYIMNPGSAGTAVSVAWLARNRANPDPRTVDLDVAAGETVVLEDVVLSEFGLQTGAGALRITAQQVVIVNSRIYSAEGGQTFGQGFEGVPTGMAVDEGATARVVGLSSGTEFRTNFYACALAGGATLDLELVDPAGEEIASGTVELEQWMPVLDRIDHILSSGPFVNASLVVEVISGAAVFGASKVDTLSSDPTTLEASLPFRNTSNDGRFELRIVDSEGFSSGGILEIEGGIVQRLELTYSNWDKRDGDTALCPAVFIAFADELTPISIEDLEDGIEFVNSYTQSDLGSMQWEVDLAVSERLTVSGSVDATGSGFPADFDGCNGSFPSLQIHGGKALDSIVP